MSEEIKPTPEEVIQARKDKEAKINARIAELKLCEGKTFHRNDGHGHPVKVIKYAGIFVKDGVGIYTFAVEVRGHAAWNAGATDFLATHHVVETPAETTTSTDPI